MASVVYFAQATDGLIKIGRSVNVAARLRAFPGARLLATVPGDFGAERKLHERFKACRVRGEWFRPDAPLLDFIAAPESPAAHPLEEWIASQPGMTRSQFAAKIGAAGDIVSRIIHGKVRPSDRVAKLIAEVTGGAVLLGRAKVEALQAQSPIAAWAKKNGVTVDRFRRLAGLDPALDSLGRWQFESLFGECPTDKVSAKIALHLAAVTRNDVTADQIMAYCTAVRDEWNAQQPPRKPYTKRTKLKVVAAPAGGELATGAR